MENKTQTRGETIQTTGRIRVKFEQVQRRRKPLGVSVLHSVGHSSTIWGVYNAD